MADTSSLPVSPVDPVGPNRRVTVAVSDLAASVVAALAPEQNDLLVLVTRRWSAGQLPSRRRGDWLGGSVGFGVDPAVLGEVIYPLLTGVLAEVTGNAVLTAWLRRRWWRRRGPAAVATPPDVRVTIDEHQLAVLRVACETYGVTLGLSKPRSAILADAVCGALARHMSTQDVSR